MKKFAHILLLLLATLFVAHTLIPHHHHNNMVCVESSDNPIDNNSHQHDSEANDHNHHDNNDIKSCILYQFVPNQNNQTQNICESLNGKNDYSILIFAFLFSEIDKYSQKLTEFSYPPIIQSDYSVIVSKCFGLRAPPVV